MDDEVFELLVKISKEGPYTLPDRKTRTREIMISDEGLYDKLQYLLSIGMVVRCLESYVLTEYGCRVAKFKDWDS